MNSLGVKNIYELLDEDSSGGIESGKKVQAAIQQQKKEAIAASKPAVVAKPTTAAATSQPKKQNERKGDKQVGDKARSDRPRFDRGDRKPRNPDSPDVEGGEERRDRKRFNGERRPRVEGEAPRGNKRVFDRRSGTGRSLKENKKGGAGKGNWGTATDEQAATIEEGVKTETEETKKEGEEATTEENTGAAAAQEKTQQVAAAEPEEEEEEKVRTLDEYLNSKKTVAALPEQRVVQEDTGKWKNYVAIKEDDEEGLFSLKQKKEKAAAKEQAAADSKNKVSADQVIKFQKENPNKRQNDRRGGNNKPNVAGKQNRGPKQATPVISDEKSFPALSPKA